MLLLSSNKRPRITIHSLADLNEDNDLIEKCAELIEGKWGYLRNKGKDYRVNLIKSISKDFYIAKYDNLFVAMFSLQQDPNIRSALHLMYLYVIESLRHNGVGGVLMKVIKNIAFEAGKYIILETLNPKLNQFYKRHGATSVCDSSIFGHPTTLLKITPPSLIKHPYRP